MGNKRGKGEVKKKTKTKVGLKKVEKKYREKE